MARRSCRPKWNNLEEHPLKPWEKVYLAMGESNPAGGRTLVFPQETLLKVQQNCEQIPLGMMRKAITVADSRDGL